MTLNGDMFVRNGWLSKVCGAYLLAISFLPSVTEAQIGSASSYQQVASTVWAYLSGDDSVVHSTWHRKLVDHDGVSVTARDGFQAVGGPSGRHEITTIQLNYDDFAIVRVDDRSFASVLLLTLFIEDGKWFVVNEVNLAPDVGTRNPHFSAENAAAEVSAAMAVYYEAVEFGRPEDLESLFNEHWHMKNPDNNELVAEDKPTFIKRIESGPSEGYYDDRQVTGLEILFDKVALMRVDNPTTRSTTVFTFVRMDSDWQMIDKSWGYPPEDSLLLGLNLPGPGISHRCPGFLLLKRFTLLQ